MSSRMITRRQPAEYGVALARTIACMMLMTGNLSGGPGDPPRGPLELWAADASTGRARRLLGGLNTVIDE